MGAAGVFEILTQENYVSEIYIAYVVSPVTDARDVVSVDLDLPRGAIVGVSTVRFKAEPAGHTTIGNVARVRAADHDTDAPSNRLIIDFGGLRSVSSLSTGATISTITPWLGTAFSDDELAITPSGSEYRFDEIRTERLLVTQLTSMSPSSAAGGAVTINDAPADLEVVVGGERVHFVPGLVRGANATHTEVIDVSNAIQAAVDAGQVPVTVQLRSSVPGQLSIAPQLDYLHAHQVVFPEGVRRTLAANEEGQIDVALPLGDEARAWNIRMIRFELAGEIGEARVLPPLGPVFSADAELICDPDHPIVIRIPPAMLARFSVIHAVRLPIATAGSAELAGFLRDETLGPTNQPYPGDQVPEATFAPTAVEPFDSFRWVTLPLGRPLPVDPGIGLWASIQVTRGLIRVPLAPQSGAPDEQALVRRQAPNGLFRPLPTVTGVATGAVGLRVIGTPPKTAPIDSVVIAVAGPTAATNGQPDLTSLSTTPTSDPSVHELRYRTSPVRASDGPGGSETVVVLRLTVTGPGDYTIGPVTIGYEEPA
jgi:hypothetical protein